MSNNKSATHAVDVQARELARLHAELGQLRQAMLQVQQAHALATNLLALFQEGENPVLRGAMRNTAMRLESMLARMLEEHTPEP